jgi:hypothetical protein
MFIFSFLGFAVALGITVWARIRFDSLWIRVGFIFVAIIVGLAEFAFVGILFSWIFPSAFPPQQVGRAFANNWTTIVAGAATGYFVPRGKIIRPPRKAR